MDRVLNVVATVAGITVGVVAMISKRYKAEEKPEQELPFALLNALLDDDAILDVVRLMPAASAARLARVSKAAHERLMSSDVALWCAESRKRLLSQRAVPGDLPLAFTRECQWTLERVHLCEHPPRFPRILFRFASDALEEGSGPSSELAKVAKLLRRHPRLRLRVHGYAQPDAPPQLGEALAQARAATVRRALLEKLADVEEFADEAKRDRSQGVKGILKRMEVQETRDL